jgi:hypothetical protein
VPTPTVYSLYNAVLKVRDALALNYPHDLETNRIRAKVAKQADSSAEQDRDQVDMDFVKQARFEALLRNIRAGYRDIFIAGGLFRSFNGLFNAIGNEGKRRSRLDPFLRDSMRYDEMPSSPRRIASPPMSDIEGSTSRHPRADISPGFSEQFRAGARNFECHVSAWEVEVGIPAGVPIEKRADLIVWKGDKAI